MEGFNKMTITPPPAPPAISLDPSQAAALGAMQRGDNVFLTGNAGTGKSTVVTSFLGQSFRTVDVTATTGIAALNLRDQFSARCGLTLQVRTVYQWAGIGLGPQPGETNEVCLARLREDASPSRAGAWKRVRAAECLIIDEISMLPGRVFGFLEFLCRHLRDQNRPWGGLQVIAVGDFLQLPPVSKSGVYDWAFMAPAWQATGFRPACLTKIHRQADPEFMGLLNAVRVGRISKEHTALLGTRIARFPKANLLRLFTHNIQVDKWNDSRLEAIEGPLVTYSMQNHGQEYECAWLRKNLLTPEKLDLKVGARVMVTVNLKNQDGELYAVNGLMGTIVDLFDDCVRMLADDGRELTVEEFEWKSDPSARASSSVRQLPLRLAWASTIHKSQGLSLDAALIDARATREPGQTYTALSRVRSLSGLWLRDAFSGVWVSPEAIKFARSLS